MAGQPAPPGPGVVAASSVRHCQASLWFADQRTVLSRVKVGPTNWGGQRAPRGQGYGTVWQCGTADWYLWQWAESVRRAARSDLTINRNF